jgi:hypothetical protein
MCSVLVVVTTVRAIPNRKESGVEFQRSGSYGVLRWRKVMSELDGPEWSQQLAAMDDIHSILAHRQVHQWSLMMQKK